MKCVERAACGAAAGPRSSCSFARRRAAAAAPRATRLARAAAPLGAGASALAGAPVAGAERTARRTRTRTLVVAASLVPEFTPRQVTVDEPLGEGSFGQVYLGTLRRVGLPPATGALLRRPRSNRPPPFQVLRAPQRPTVRSPSLPCVRNPLCAQQLC
jgi:hypothetical protein